MVQENIGENVVLSVAGDSDVEISEVGAKVVDELSVVGAKVVCE